MGKLISLRKPVIESPPGPAKSRPGLPVAPAVAEFLTDVRRRLCHGTYLDYRHKIDVLARWADERKIGLEYIGRKVMADFVDHLVATHQGKHAQPISDNTKAGYTRVAKVFLNWCRKDETYAEYMSSDTIDMIELPKVAKTILVTFTDEQIKLLYKVAGQAKDPHAQSRNIALLHVLANTGIRASEAITLSIGNVNLDPFDASITVMGKGKKMRRIILGELTRRKLESYILAFRKDAAPGDRVFLSLSSRNYLGNMTLNGIEELINALVKRAGIDNFRASCHDFRHYFACSFMKRGGDVFALSKLLGHNEIKTTQRYLESIGQGWDMRERVAGLMR